MSFIKGYEFVNNIDPSEVTDCYDTWGEAILFRENGCSGVEYNLCIDSGNNCSAIYPFKDAETDYAESNHYEIDFNDVNWKKKLFEVMRYVLEHYERIGFYTDYDESEVD